MAQQQYSYGYGYPAAAAYAYPQAPVAATGFVGYAPAARPTYSPTPPASAPPPPQPQAVPQPTVGYSPYNTAHNSPSSNPTYPPPPQGSAAPAYGQSAKPAQYSQPQTPQAPQTPSYQSYSAYKPQTPSYTPYYDAVKSQATPASTISQTISASATTTYVPTYTLTSSSGSTTGAVGGSTTGVVGYPPFSQSSYASSANAYYKQMKENKATAQAANYSTQGYSAPSTAPSASNAANLTPVQQQVVRQYISQKTQGNNYQKKKVYTPPVNPETYYCEVCKISCASALTYKTHLEGKTHKKKLNQQQKTGDKDKINHAFYCELCDVMCSNKDGLEAHVRGSKHTKVVNLYKRMGKPIPVPKTSMPSGSSSGTAEKPVMVTAPRISFVGGKQLSSTGIGYKEAEVAVYPQPSTKTSAASTPATAPVAAVESEEKKTTAQANGDTAAEDDKDDAEATTEEPEPEPVGEHLVITVSNDPKFPHANYKCEMCDCYFNDAFAKRAHVKGRRHRLNYKKTYDSSIYVEPTKAMKKEMEKRKKARETQREMIGELRKLASAQRGRGRGRGGWRGGHSYFSGGDWGGERVDVREMRRQETLEKARMDQQIRMREDYPPMPHPPPPMALGPPPLLPTPRNPHDDKLVMNKHNSILPSDVELEAVDSVVNDVETTLKVISDDLLAEECQGKPGEKAQKDETKRMLKGVMRVGAFARGLLLKGECHVELILMTASKPDISLFQALDSRIPAKFEELKKTGAIKNIYNVTPDCTKAVFLIVAQVADFRVSASVTLTSTTMREEPTPEQAKADEDGGVLDRPSCLAALAALRHTKWFQAMAHDLPSCIVVMRVLRDISRRVPAWGVLDAWILQLLVQKCIVSANSDFTKPGDVFRRVMECVASGLFLPGGAGLCDPCEKGVVDASASLTAQERANITLSAQHALRLIAFEKLHLVLGVDPLLQEDTALGTKRDANSPESSDNCKKIKLA